MKIKTKLYILFLTLSIIPFIISGAINLYSQETYYPIIGTMILFFFAALLVSKHIISPLQLLVTSAKTISHGDLSHRIKIETGNEFEELADTFNEMAQTLERRTQEFADNLTEVQEKNKQVEQANKALIDSNLYLEYVVEEVRYLMERSVEEKEFKARFNNPKLVNCWELKKCNNSTCPAYGKPGQRCWHIADTICPGTPQHGKFADKIEYCKNCEVYQSAMKDKIHVLGELFNNMMKYMEDRQEQLLEQLEKCTASLEQTNQELQGAQTKLMQSNKMLVVGKLVIGVSPRFNTLIGGILDHSHVILDKIKQKNDVQTLSPEELKLLIAFVTYAEENAQHCNTIVTELLEFSRISNAEIASLDINQVLKTTFDLMQHQLYINEIQLVPNLAPNLPQIMGNKHYLQQAFSNLILYVQQSMKNRGKLTVSTVCRENKYLNKFFIKVCFSDTSYGIPEEYLDKVFEPFFAIEGVQEGVGLGLSVSYEILKAHNGQIKVESKLGEGTTFNIEFPVKGRNVK